MRKVGKMAGGHLVRWQFSSEAGMFKRIPWANVLATMYVLGGISTFVYLTFIEDYCYTSRNWIIAIPLNVFFADIWPIYWLTLRPVLAP